MKPDNLAQLKTAYPHLSIRFLTVHASKGLEADHVVILRTASERMGFSSEIVDDPLLDMVLPESEKEYHAEERRLFYVAQSNLNARHPSVEGQDYALAAGPEASLYLFTVLRQHLTWSAVPYAR